LKLGLVLENSRSGRVHPDSIRPYVIYQVWHCNLYGGGQCQGSFLDISIDRQPTLRNTAAWKQGTTTPSTLSSLSPRLFVKHFTYVSVQGSQHPTTFSEVPPNGYGLNMAVQTINQLCLKADHSHADDFKGPTT